MGDEGQNQQKPPLQQPVPPCHGALDTAGQQSQLAPVLAAGMHARTSRRAEVQATPASDTKRPETEAQRPKPRSPKLRSPKPRSPKLRSPKQPAAAAPSENQEKKSKKRKKEKRRVGDKKQKTNEGESCLGEAWLDSETVSFQEFLRATK